MTVGDPRGFRSFVAGVGGGDQALDLSVVLSDRPAAAAAVFTRSRFASPSVEHSRRNAASGTARAVVTVSKNANTANGEHGRRDCAEVVELVADRCGIAADDVLIASTGVIGRRYPMEPLRSALRACTPSSPADLDLVGRAIMTTDTHPKVTRLRLGGATLVGLAKGVGMVEPDMATLLTFYFTDAEIDGRELDAVFRRVMDRTFNCLSIDADTSTNDMAVVLANGVAGPVPADVFEDALGTAAETLTKQVARDGEGATKLFEVSVDGARDVGQARRVGKAIVNSTLVKTAVHGANPNWGRIAMAIGKCFDDTDIDQDRVVIRIGDVVVYPAGSPDPGRLNGIMARDEVLIHVSLGIGSGSSRVWGCDITEEYVRMNARCQCR